MYRTLYLKYFLKLTHGNSAVGKGDFLNTDTHLESTGFKFYQICCISEKRLALALPQVEGRWQDGQRGGKALAAHHWSV